MKGTDKSFRSEVYTDSVEVRCPCGQMKYGEGDRIDSFFREHMDHTDGLLVMRGDGPEYVSDIRKIYADLAASRKG